ncbi:MAG: S1 RNA-binding domain-containing protein, partial [Nitrosarchaeum sp.]|nr:S1 RNA-binding domain-containing protein [Nitrosarchaeum sp.]
DVKVRKESGEIITTKISNINKGGLIVEVNGIQGFLPLSQLSADHYPKVEGGDTTKIVQILQKFKGQELRVKILDFNEEENKLIVSEKAINEAQVQEQLKQFTVGDVVKGKITDVTDFGAFMLLQIEDNDSELQDSGEKKSKGTIEGLIHISEIAWKMIDNPRNILSPGQEVEAKIISIENGKISLSLKALIEDPWLSIKEKYSVDQKISGTVAKTTNYGALISLDDSITGLIPIPEFGGKKPSDVLTIGNSIDVIVVSIDTSEHKMLLKFENSLTDLKSEKTTVQTEKATEEQVDIEKVV